MNMIFATDLNYVIGKDNQIPWIAPGDMEFFREVTMGSVLVMGRKTAEGIMLPLPGRDAYVISTTKEKIKGAVVIDHRKISLRSFLLYLSVGPYNDIFIIGGKRLFEEAFEFCDPWTIKLQR